MKHLQPKTLQVMNVILSLPAFSQRLVWRICKESNKISLGQVNKVIMDLERKSFIERLFHRQSIADLPRFDPKLHKGIDPSETVSYRPSDPIGLVRYIALFRSMVELRIFSIQTNASIDTIVKEMAQEKVIFCLGTAQSRYSSYFRPDEVSFYSTNIEKIIKKISNAPYGNNKIGCYRIDYVRTVKDQRSLVNGYFASQDGPIALTTKVQTVIDMFCDGKGAYAKSLIKELWGIET